jgi:urease accessory protein
MQLAERGGSTTIARRFSHAPFGPAHLTFPDDSGIPEVQLTNPGGGTLGGDHLDLEVAAEARSRATVATQAANKVYRGPEAVQRAALRLGPAAFLEYIPHHVIPFAGSRYRQETAVDMAPSAVLVAWESFSAGRLALGERFAFSALSTRLRVARDGALEILDGFELGPGGEPLGGYSYLATVFILAPTDLSQLAERLHAFLATVPGFASASAPGPGLVTARLLATEAPSLYLALNGIRAIARAELGVPPPPRSVN